METVAQSTISKRAKLDSATYTLAEFAARLGISYTTAHEAAQRDALPVKAIRQGRLYLFPRAHVHRLLGLSDDDASRNKVAS